MSLEFKQASDSFENLDGIQKQIALVSKGIYATAAYSEDTTSVRMKLPSPAACDNEFLALAIEYLLSEHFSIVIPGKALMKLKNGVSVKFLVTILADLPPLTVIIIVDADKRQLLSIQGSAPKHGINGFSVLVFHWQQESGLLDKQGNINLKKINKLPSVKAGDLLAQVYEPTPGVPGISCQGKRIPQAPGIRLDLHWDEESVVRRDEPPEMSETPTYKLYARLGGIVRYSLRSVGNPKSLCDLSVCDTVVINGDIDYGVGDQGEMDQSDHGCESNIIIEGSVRGVFSIHSNGFIQVKKAIEGTVSGKNVETALITRGSSVTAKMNITAGSIINATAKAQTITVQENTNDSTLHATEKVILHEGATCMSLTVHTKQVESKNTRFSGVSRFVLGEELFQSVDEHVVRIKVIARKIAEFGGPLKDIAETIVDHLAFLNSIVKKGPAKFEGQAVKMLEAIKITIVRGFQSVDRSIDSSVMQVAYQMQSLLGDHKFDESILRKVDLLIKSISSYNQKASEVAPYVQELKIHEEKLSRLQAELTDEITLSFTNIELLSSSTELIITCGEAEYTIRQADISTKSFIITYHPPDDVEKLRKGTLELLPV